LTKGAPIEKKGEKRKRSTKRGKKEKRGQRPVDRPEEKQEKSPDIVWIKGGETILSRDARGKGGVTITNTGRRKKGH